MCSSHFSEDDYIKTSERCILKFNAVPTLNLHLSEDISTEAISFAVPHSSKTEGDIGMGQSLEQSSSLSSEQSQSGSLTIKRKRRKRLVIHNIIFYTVSNYYLPN